MSDDTDLRVLVARLEERLEAANTATELAGRNMEAWKANSNEWRQTLQDRDSRYVTRSDVIALMAVGFSIVLFLTALVGWLVVSHAK